MDFTKDHPELIAAGATLGAAAINANSKRRAKFNELKGEHDFQEYLKKQEQKEKDKKKKKSVKESSAYLTTLEYFAENNIQLSKDQINSLKESLSVDPLNEVSAKALGIGATAVAGIGSAAALGSKITKDRIKAKQEKEQKIKDQQDRAVRERMNKAAARDAYDRQMKYNYIRDARNKADRDFSYSRVNNNPNKNKK